MTVRGEPNPRAGIEGVPGSSGRADDLVDEASEDSFPCSDPPTFTSLHAGLPAPPVVVLEAPPEAAKARPRATDEGPALRSTARAQGLFYVATGLWPLVHLRSFEAVTGPKRDRWLVRTVGLLVTSIGAALLAGSRTGVTRPLVILGATAPAALAAIDVVYVAKRRIRKTYLLDAVVELGLVAAWGLLSLKGRRSR